MRIAILSCFYPYRGGIAQFNAAIYQELGKAHDVAAFNFKRQYPGFLFPGKTQYVTPEDEAFPVPSQALLDSVNPLSWLRTARAIEAWNPDLVIVRYWMPFFGPSLGYVTRRLRKRCKVISILDNVIPHERRFFDKPFSKYFLRGSSGSIVMCSEVASDLRALQPDARYRILPHPLYSHFGEKLPREEAERMLGLRPGKKNLLFFGLIREYKGLDILLEAFRDLGDDYQLVVAGEPYGSFAKYQALIDACPGRDRIRLFPEYIRDSEVKKYFSAADVTVLPYRSATQSGISSVSYHFEVPMITTGVGGLREAVEGAGTGLVAEEVSPAAVKREIERYFADPQLQARCVENIRKEKERLSWNRFCRELLGFADTL